MAKYRKLGMVSSHRRAVLRNMTTDVIKHGRVTTTVTRAKEAKRMVDKMITLGKKNTLHSRRQAISYMMDEEVVKTLFDEVAPKYESRQGGYTRILKVGPRRGDGAPMAIIELV